MAGDTVNEAMGRASSPGDDRPSPSSPRHLRHYVPASLALLVIGGLFLVVSDRLRLGPPWLPFLAVALLLIPLTDARRRGHVARQRWLALSTNGLVTLLLLAAAFSLVRGMLDKTLGAPELLQAGLLLWVVNILTFAIWYWEIDAGGPLERHRIQYAAIDFVFPQLTIDSKRAVHWAPHFVDYLFLAFNTSTAFSPTDTLVLSGRAKLLMMAQSLLSLLTIAVLLARGINTL